MRSVIKPALWCCLIISLFFMIPSVNFRLSSEKINKSVVITADFYEFMHRWKLLSDSNANSPEPREALTAFIQWLKESGISTVALKEVVHPPYQYGYGFDTYILDKLSSSGLEVILRPRGISHAQHYFEDLENMVSKYKIKYFIFDEGNSSFNQSDIDNMSDIVSQNGIIICLAENINQTGPVKTPGLDSLLAETNYPVNRSYIIPSGDLRSITGDNLTYRWLRAVTDRNIRVVYVRPLNSPAVPVKDNISNTFQAVKELSSLLKLKGFEVNGKIEQISEDLIKSSPEQIALIFNIFCAVFLLLLYLGINRYMRFNILFISCFCAVNTYFYLFTSYHNMLEAITASVLYPSLAVTIILFYLKEKTHHSLALRISVSLITLLSVSFAGAMVVTASMSDIRYIMHLVNFSGALATYTLPLILFVIAYLKLLRNCDIRVSLKALPSGFKLSFKHIFLVILSAIILYIYLSRSGNNSLIPASNMELEFRKFLEKALSARPRIKEYLIGYPCLFAFIYKHYHKPDSKLLIPLGLGTTIGGISIVNSFCHGFTPFITSVSRTVNGVLLGVLASSLILVSAIAVKKLVDISPNYYSSSSSVRK